MQTVKIKPVQIVGRCPAGLAPEDEFRIEELRLENPRGSKICFLAVSQIPIGQGIWQLQSEERFFSHVSCPGCIPEPGDENRVVFLLGHLDKWELCESISAYLRLSKQFGEPEAARALKEAAIRHQSKGEYEAATREMAAAVMELSTNKEA